MLEFVTKAAVGAGREKAKSLTLGLGSFGSVARTEIGPREGVEEERIGTVGGGDGVVGKVEGFGGLSQIGLINLKKSVGVFVPFNRSGGGLLRHTLEEGEGILGSLVGGSPVARFLETSGEREQGYGEPER